MFYQTQYTDPTTNDVLMQARWYAPTSGTFRSRDTYAGDLNTPVSLNRYTYANNNPIRYSDPSGRCANPDRCEGALKRKEITTAEVATKFTRSYQGGAGALSANVPASADAAACVCFPLAPPPPPEWRAALDSPDVDGASASYGYGEIDPIPGAGRVQLNLFIPMKEVCWWICIKGDGRDFNREATLVESRATVLIDFETGWVGAGYNHSEFLRWQGGFDRSRHGSAYPTALTVAGPIDGANFRSVMDGPGKNSVNIFQQSPSQLVIGFEGEISVGLPGSPSINGFVNLEFDDQGFVSAQKGGNEFPAYEIYQDINGQRREVRTFEAQTHGYLFDGVPGWAFRVVATNDYIPDWFPEILGGSG